MSKMGQHFFEMQEARFEQDEIEAADCSTLRHFHELIERYKTDVRQLSPEARAEIKQIADELKTLKVMQ